MEDVELIEEQNNMEFKTLICLILAKNMMCIKIKKMIMFGSPLKIWSYIKLNYQCNKPINMPLYFNKNERI